MRVSTSGTDPINELSHLLRHSGDSCAIAAHAMPHSQIRRYDAGVDAATTLVRPDVCSLLSALSEHNQCPCSTADAVQTSYMH